MDSFGYFWILLDTFGFFWILLDSFGFLWILLDSFGRFWNQLDYFGIFWILLSLQAVSEGSLCKLFLQLNSLNTLESFRAAWLALNCGSSELLSSSLGILGA